jgi:hypothetical protein
MLFNSLNLIDEKKKMIIYAVANNPEVKISDIPISDNY